MELSILCGVKVFMFIYDQSETRMVHYQSHLQDNLQLIVKKNISKEYYTNQDYEKIVSKKDKDITVDEGSVIVRSTPDFIEKIEQQILDLSNVHKRQQYESIQNQLDIQQDINSPSFQLDCLTEEEGNKDNNCMVEEEEKQYYHTQQQIINNTSQQQFSSKHEDISLSSKKQNKKDLSICIPKHNKILAAQIFINKIQQNDQKNKIQIKKEQNKNPNEVTILTKANIGDILLNPNQAKSSIQGQEDGKASSQVRKTLFIEQKVQKQSESKGKQNQQDKFQIPSPRLSAKIGGGGQIVGEAYISEIPKDLKNQQTSNQNKNAVKVSLTAGDVSNNSNSQENCNKEIENKSQKSRITTQVIQQVSDQFQSPGTSLNQLNQPIISQSQAGGTQDKYQGQILAQYHHQQQFQQLQQTYFNGYIPHMIQPMISPQIYFGAGSHSPNDIKAAIPQQIIGLQNYQYPQQFLPYNSISPGLFQNKIESTTVGANRVKDQISFVQTNNITTTNILK